MDRASFLSCLPFLSSESFSSWPPPPLCAKQNTFDGGNGDAPLLLLENYLLSIEPRSCDNEAATLGPACFASPPTTSVATTAADNGIDGDSSICQFNMAISPPSNSDSSHHHHHNIHHNKSTSPGSVSTNGTSTTTSQSPKTPLRNSGGAVFLRPTAASTKVFVRMEDKHCFRVDLRQFEKMQLLFVPNQSNNDEVTLVTQPQQRPPCLLLMFEICCFRIFSLKKDQGTAHKELESVYNCLQVCVEDLALHREGTLGMYSSDDWANSFGASSGSNSAGHGSSSNEAGQGHTTTAATSTSIHGVTAAMPSCHDNDGDGGGAQQRGSPQVGQQPILQNFDNDGKALALVLQQRQACFLKSREGLQSLNTVLEMPAWIWERGDLKRRRLLPESHGENEDDDDDEELNVLREHLSDSLTSTADHLSASYWASRHERNQAILFYETQMQGYQQEMDQLLSKAFPRIHRGRWPAVASSTITTPARMTTTTPDRKRRKPTSQPETPSMTTQDTVHHDSPTQSSSSRWLIQAKATMKRQRQVLEARHRLSLLPMRK